MPIRKDPQDINLKRKEGEVQYINILHLTIQ